MAAPTAGAYKNTNVTSPPTAIGGASTPGAGDSGKRIKDRGQQFVEDFMAQRRKLLGQAIEATSTNRSLQVDDIRFAAGSPDNKYQWPESVVRSREADPNGPRPVLTINKLPQHILQVTNEQRHNRPSIKVMPVDDKADPEIAEVLTGIIRHIEYQSDADVAYATAGENQVTHGEGFIRVLTDYCDEMSFEQDIMIEQVKNAFSVYMEPLALLRDATGRYCEWCFIVQDMTKDEYERTYPNAAPVSWQDVGQGDEWKAWFPDNDTVRIAEHFYCVYEERTLCRWADGSVTVKEEMPEGYFDFLEGIGQRPVEERKTQVKRVKWCKLSGVDILEENDWAGKHIPVVRVVGNEWYIDGKFVTAGIVRNAKDAQRMFNYWKSTETETLALAPKSPFVGPAEAFNGYEDDWQEANTKAFAYLKYNQFNEGGERIDRPERQIPPMPPVGIVNAALGAADDIKSATGQYDPSLGNNPQSKSGVALRQEQLKSDIGTFHYIDNQARAVKQLGRILVDLIPKIYDTSRVARILGEDGEPQHAMLDPAQEQAVGERENPQTGKIEKIYNPSIGRYDVTVAVGPGYTTKRQEAAEFMAQVLQGNKELMAVMGDLYFEMLDVPGADAIAKRLKKTLPPNLAEPEEGEEQQMVQTPEGPVPVEAAGQMLAQMGAQIQELSQRLQQADEAGAQAKIADAQTRAADAETKRLAAEARAAADEAKAMVDGFRAETERLSAGSNAELNEAKIKQMMFEALRDFVDRTPEEDSGLLSPLRKSDAAERDGAQGEMT